MFELSNKSSRRKKKKERIVKGTSWLKISSQDVSFSLCICS